ncbi:hypothetical protein V5799_013375 [Amblyomma americanum]|uniref:Uncharacterized protein n=1 Tax=Amblyomma americanum TaxID=6943 RepID=A0AAQ4E638_AMBAM
MHVLSDCPLSDTRHSVVNFLAPEYFVLADNPGLALNPLARQWTQRPGGKGSSVSSPSRFLLRVRRSLAGAEADQMGR